MLCGLNKYITSPSRIISAELGEEGEQFVTVPHNDYRAIRRAVLDLDCFYAQV